MSMNKASQQKISETSAQLVLPSLAETTEKVISEGTKNLSISRKILNLISWLLYQILRFPRALWRLFRRIILAIFKRKNRKTVLFLIFAVLMISFVRYLVKNADKTRLYVTNKLPLWKRLNRLNSTLSTSNLHEMTNQ